MENLEKRGTTVKLKNGKYKCEIQCTHKTADGKRKKFTATAAKKVDAIRKAREKADAWDNALDNGIVLVADIKNQTIKETFEKWLEDYAAKQGWASSTANTYNNRVQNMIYKKVGIAQIKDINTAYINKLIKSMLETHSRQDVGLMYSLLRQYCAYLTKNGAFTSNPFLLADPLPPRARIRKELTQEQASQTTNNDDYMIFTEDEILKIKKFSISDPKKSKALQNHRYYANIFYFMFLTGLRSQEMRALKESDFDFTNKTLKINKALSISKINGKEQTVETQPKTKNSIRTISINEDAMIVALNILKFRPNKDNEYLVCTKNGTWMERRNFIKYFDKVLKDCDIEKKGRTPHSLRHTFISFAIEKNDMSPLKNCEPIIVSRYVGHSSLSITLDVYTHISQNKMSNIDLNDTFTVTSKVIFDE